ncbi:unnamed protein product [Peronospora belbahrii]|uniref:Peptidase A2 domain-containing protein n=1 Tax=Peronospora belbahrii TaxID=622444 RepID=A0AAU9KQP9_9STRA|nr:unnamed protein product [Peronospora belbahrii]CAH0521443.1 unnamed protein product [Peronospora belbahrii]
MLFDTGAEISILDIAFAPKVGCQIDESERQEIVGIGKYVYTTERRTRIKVTLNGNLVYIFKVRVGPMVGQNAISGMKFMVPAGIRLDLADGTLCLPDDVRVQLAGRRALYDNRVSDMKLGRYVQIPAGVRGSASKTVDLAPMEVVGHKGRTVDHDREPRGRKSEVAEGNEYQRLTPDFARGHQERYAERLKLVYESTTDQVDYQEDLTGKDEGPLVEVPQYSTPIRILSRPRILVSVRAMAFQPKVDHEEPQVDRVDPEVDQVDLEVDQVGGELWAEDVDQGWAIIPEFDPLHTSIKLEDKQIPDSDGNTPEEVDRLRQIIWRRRHLLRGKGNALPPASRGAICDIDVGNAKPIAQRVRKVPPQFEEKLADLIKGLLSAKIIQPSTSPWPS